MFKVRSAACVAAVLLTSATSLALAQTSPSASSAPRAPGVTRAVEHPDDSSPDPTVDQTRPDDRQPETAVDKERGVPETAKDDSKLKPETAKDDQKLKPETASDAPPKPSSAQRRMAEVARQGVRSNTPPPKKPSG